ncbi:MAG: hypothetical protein JO359_11660 [Candidatus Eremiobacteraeota bacterium]|nr:hypothetical protein [Candidatus Eremiobacteraeota bacterium]
MARPYNLYRCPEGHERRSYATAEITGAPPTQSKLWCIEWLDDGSMCRERAVFVETNYGEQMNHAATFYANDVEVTRGTLVKRHDRTFTFKTAPFAESLATTTAARLTVAVHRHGTTPLVLDDCHVIGSGGGELVLTADQIIGDEPESSDIISLL